MEKMNPTPDHEKNQEGQISETDFITEKIKQRPINKKKLLRRTLITAAMAAIFGMVACLTFLVLEPVISNWLYPEEEPDPIVLPAETEEMMPEDMIADESQISVPEEPPEFKLEDEQIAQLLSDMKMDTNHYAGMYSAMAQLAKDVKKSVVTVTGSISSVDWFNNPYESKDQTAGIIVAISSKEVIILVNNEEIMSADTLYATFDDGEQVKATRKRYDANTNLAVVAVEVKDLSGETMGMIKAADLSGSSGNDSLVGSPVIAIGSPLGSGESICYGIVTSNGTAIHLTDANYKLITTDIYGSAKASGILVNLKGQVIGMIDNHYNSEGMENLVAALGITELRPLVEQMSNEKHQPYLGTKGTDVPEEINETLGVPVGAYITEIAMDSPAMTAGIQSGDIITQIGGQEIKNYSALTTALSQAAPEQNVGIRLMRQGPEEYVDMEVNVTLGKME